MFIKSSAIVTKETLKNAAAFFPIDNNKISNIDINVIKILYLSGTRFS
ncbi:hypothetical protein JPSP12_18490 [Staphylococcus pseudintermedius]